MKTQKIICSILFLGISCMGLQAQNSKRVVILALDGMSVDGYQQANTPVMDALMEEGALSLKTRVVNPSVTLPNWTSHLTGSGPEQNGVVDNSWKVDSHTLEPVTQDAEGYYPSVFKVLKENVSDVKIGFYYEWGSLINSLNPKYMDEIKQIDVTATSHGVLGEMVYEFVEKNQDDPTVIFYICDDVDGSGHRHGWKSQEYYKAIEAADQNFGILIAKMKEAGLYEDTYFFILSDHGGINTGHGGVTLDEMNVPWGVRGPGIKQGLKITDANNTVNTATTILNIFDIKQPQQWVGQTLECIYSKRIPKTQKK
ncbi:MAG: alkaline phosphatase family protein [Rikenellaceae bacterium]